MKVAIFSDLHLESNKFSASTFAYAGSEADVIVLAGDIVDADRYYLLGAIRSLVPQYVPILFTPGNHEYYHAGSVKGHRNLLRKYCRQNNIVFLDRDTFEFNGHLFIGATGWADLTSYAIEAEYSDWDVIKSVEEGIGDFSYIGGWTAKTMQVQSGIDRHFIKKSIKTADMEKLTPFVVTHFPPLEVLNSRRFFINQLSPFFANDWADLAAKVNGYWVYGHTHDNHQPTMVNNAMFICNQHGYRGECAGTFNPYYILDLSEYQ